MKNNRKQIKKGRLIYSLDEDTSTASVVGNDSAYGDIIIPRFVEYQNQEFIVQSIKEFSFYKARVKSIQFPADSEVKTIDKYSFRESEIQSITIPPSVSELKIKCFYQADYLKKVTIMPNNPHYKNHEDDDNLIVGKSDTNSSNFDVLVFAIRHIVKVTIPNGINIIGPNSFSCSKIESLTIPPHITKICKRAFYNCNKLSHVNFHPDSQIQVIDKYVFGYTQLRYVKIPPSVSEFKEGCFFYSNHLEEVIIMPGNQYLKNYQDDNKVVVGKSDINSEEYDILYFVSRKFTEFTIPASIKIIGPSAFSGSAIANITIPSQVTEICKCAFENTGRLKSVKFEPNSKLRVIEPDAFLFSEIESISLPPSVIELKEGWCRSTSRMSSVEIVSKNFKNCEEDPNLIIGKSDVNSSEFDVLVFASRKIKSATIPAYIKIIAPYAFMASKIESIEIPSHVIEIGKFAFCYSKLRDVKIPLNSELRVLGNCAFTSNDITHIFIPSHITQICEKDFYTCYNLETIEISEDSELKTIERKAFCNTNLTKITIPPSFCEFKEGWNID